MNQEVGKDLLVAVGMHVDIAEHGGVALEKIQHADYDLVLMDMQMPVMDGITATAAIRQLPGHETVPIIAMTANVLATDKDRCFEVGMVDFVAKPIDPQTLWHTLLKWVAPLNSVPGPHSVAAAPAPLGSWSEPHADLPWQIPGLDTRRGLLRVLGDRTRYEKVLGMFIDEQHDAVARTRRLWQLGDVHDAQRVIHTLKGSSGTIGATVLNEKVDLLESWVKNASPFAGGGSPEDASMEAMFMAVEQPLQALIAQLCSTLPRPNWEAEPPVDQASLQAMVNQLKHLLKDNDSEAFELFQSHQAALKQACPAEFDAMSAHLLNFEFEAALKSLEQAMPGQIPGHNEEQPRW
jgi:CheY-like chemotaxis protein